MINHHLTTLAVALQDLDSDAPRLQTWGTKAASELLSGGRLLTCGTGGSAEQAQHLAATLARREDDRPALAAVALATARPGVSATSEGSRSGLATQVRTLGRPGDILFCICASAGSEMTEVAATARDMAMTVWALTGPGPNPVTDACTDGVAVSAAGASTVEELHLAAVHIFCAAVDSAVRDALRAAADAGEQTSRHSASVPRWHPQLAG
ncbi:MAG TPA: SIS domain-containing protein [Streptosporangiaceae bacterium]|nr:SIS domain-containing protein [Streptosporangiaceae bacterium]